MAENLPENPEVDQLSDLISIENAYWRPQAYPPAPQKVVRYGYSRNGFLMRPMKRSKIFENFENFGQKKFRPENNFEPENSNWSKQYYDDEQE